MTLTAGDRQFPETVNAVDPNFFQVIKLPLIAGDPTQVFRQPESIVLSRVGGAQNSSAAPIPSARPSPTPKGKCADGDTPCRNTTVPLTVTGVMRDLPHNSQLTGDVFIPNTSIADYNSDEQKYDLVQRKRLWVCDSGPRRGPANRGLQNGTAA